MKPADLAPLVRILLYAVTGWLGGTFLDPDTVAFIRDDPGVLMAITGLIAGVWYAAAKWWGWTK